MKIVPDDIIENASSDSESTPPPPGKKVKPMPVSKKVCSIFQCYISEPKLIKSSQRREETPRGPTPYTDGHPPTDLNKADPHSSSPPSEAAAAGFSRPPIVTDPTTPWSTYHLLVGKHEGM